MPAGKPGSAYKRRKSKAYDPHMADKWRAKIQASMLINRLQDFANGKCQMDKGQVTAAIALLRKVLPDLAQTEHTGNALMQFARIERVIVRAPLEAIGLEAIEPPEPLEAIEHQPAADMVTEGSDSDE